MIARTRTRMGQLQYPQTIQLGTAYTERLVDNAWVVTSVTPKYYTVSSARKYASLEITTDELHAGPPWRDGGPFDSIKIQDYGLSLTGASPTMVYPSPTIRYYYIGGFMPTWAAPSGSRCIDGVNLTSIGETLGDVSSYGPEAYAKFMPLKPKVDLGQFLAEFREIPRMIKQSAEFYLKGWKFRGGGTYRKRSKRLANEWLNSQFGWVPFLSTIVDTYKATKTLSNTLARLRKYNGQWEKRGGSVKEIKNRRLFYESGAYIAPTLSSAFGQPRLRVYEVTEQDVWFTAKYKYYLPQLEEMKYPPGVIAQIYGLRITPSLLWELTPWSWLADWFTNVGDLLEASDNSQYGQTVTKQAYLMGTTTKRYNIQTKFYGLGYAERNYVLSRKQRIEASPYGFGVHFNDLSNWQVSILAALGISKSF